MMDWLIAIQKWRYGGMAAGLKSAEDVSAQPALLASAVSDINACESKRAA